MAPSGEAATPGLTVQPGVNANELMPSMALFSAHGGNSTEGRVFVDGVQVARNPLTSARGALWDNWTTSLTLPSHDASADVSIRPGPRWQLGVVPSYRRETVPRQYIAVGMSV